MDDNRTQATSAYQSGYKLKSGCDKKRDSSFLVFGISPSKKLISDVVAGYHLLPGAAAHQENNRPVNTRAGKKGIIPTSVSQRVATGLIKDRGGEKKGSSCPPDYSVHPSFDAPLIADSKYGGFPGFFSSASPCLFNNDFDKSCFKEVRIG